MDTIRKSLKNIVLALCVGGIFVSLYLTYSKLTSTPLLCLDAGCNKVQNSQYSEIFGIPVAIFGILFYFALFILVYKNKLKYAKFWALWGIIFSTYLTYLELFVIDAICTWCVISFIIVILIFILLVFTKSESNNAET